MQRFPGLVALVVLSLFLVGALPGAARADFVYVASNTGLLGYLDLTADADFGKFFEISNLKIQVPGGLAGLGAYGTNDLTAISGLGSVYTVNRVTGALTPEGSSGLNPTGAGGIDGVLYAVNQSSPPSLSSVTVPGLATQTIGTVGSVGNASGLAVDAQNGFIYVDVSESLYMIGTAPASVATKVGPSKIPSVYAGVYDPNNGTVCGFDLNHDILTINLATGAGTKVGSYSLPNGGYISAAAIPEPHALTLLGVGILCAACLSVDGRAMVPRPGI